MAEHTSTRNRHAGDGSTDAHADLRRWAAEYPEGADGFPAVKWSQLSALLDERDALHAAILKISDVVGLGDGSGATGIARAVEERVSSLRALRDALSEKVESLQGQEVESLLAVIDMQTQELEALRPNDERYLWLRKIGGRSWHCLETGSIATGGAYDAAVDAARKESSHG